MEKAAIPQLFVGYLDYRDSLPEYVDEIKRHPNYVKEAISNH